MYAVMNLYLLQLLTLFMVSIPMTLALGVLLQSMLAMIMMASSNSCWIAMAVVLIFSGGMMIMILYMTSLSTEYHIFTSMEHSKKKFFMFTFFLTCSLKDEDPEMMVNFNLTNELVSMFNQNNFMSMLFVVLYLISTMFFCVKMVEVQKGLMKLIHK